ncbi:MAG: DUF4339 domain-containing protein [Bdellovibrionaceae bacterium]|nr:DUF4339 domain-containing protein [Pseudobdellovibrionaceae bacterium]
MNQQANALKKQESKWYILRGENKYGPFEFSTMISMIQKGELFDYNYIWAAHMEGWQPLGEVEEFSKDRLSLIIKTKDPLSHAFCRRGADRAEVTIPFFGHNDEFFFNGHLISISVNGALILINNPLLLPGQKVILHLSQNNVNEKSFNVLAQIVRKNFSRQRLNVKSGLNYAVKFVETPGWAMKQIEDLVALYHQVNAVNAKE